MYRQSSTKPKATATERIASLALIVFCVHFRALFGDRVPAGSFLHGATSIAGDLPEFLFQHPASRKPSQAFERHDTSRIIGKLESRGKERPHSKFLPLTAVTYTEVDWLGHCNIRQWPRPN